MKHQAPPFEDFPEPRLLNRLAEAQLALKIANGDEDAKIELVMGNMRESLAYLWTCCKGRMDGRELVSLCYQELMVGAPRFRAGKTRFFVFMKAGLRGRMLRHLTNLGVVRKASGFETLDRLQLAERCPRTRSDGVARVGEASVPSGVEATMDRDRFEMLKKVMHRVLSDHERMVLILYYDVGMTFKQIGSLLGVCKQAAHIVHQEAIAKLQTSIQCNPQLVQDLT